MNQEYKVNLSKGQKAKLAKAIKDGSALKLRLSKNALSGNDELLLSPRQIAKLQKAKRNNSGVEISFSKSSIRKSVKQGGSLWTSLFSLGTKALPFVTKGVSKVAPHLATGALSALGSLGIDKIFGSGMQGGMILPDAIVKMLQKGIEIPVKFLVNLINMKEMLTNAQKTLIGKGLKSGKGIVLKPTKRQIHGGFWELWLQLGFPWQLNLLQKYLEAACKLLEKLGGKGLQTPRKLEQACRFRRSLFMATSPLLWYMGGAGTRSEGKRTSGKRASAGGQKPIQPHPHLGSNSLKAKPKWKDIPLSNFDLLKWVDFLKIKNFKGIFSRDSKDHLHKTGSCIINLDDKIGNGTHWVATDIKGKNVFYFDSFSMPPPIEFVHYAKKIKKKIIFNSGHPIQELQSVRCGYYCLYFLNEIREKTFYDVLSVFSLNDPDEK